MLAGIGDGAIEQRTQEEGVVGAGGGGFPTYAKWARSDDVDYLMVNQQESEPNCAIDKWRMKNNSYSFADFFRNLTEHTLEKVVISAKQKDQEWLQPLIDRIDTTTLSQNDLPVEVEDIEDDIIVSYSEDTYEYGMESVLLQNTVGTTIGRDLPMDHGWIVQNTETVYNIYQALHSVSTIKKLLHVDGYVNGKRLNNAMYYAPVGTPAEQLFNEAGINLSDHEECVIVDGGPGWGFDVTNNPVVTKATNCLMLLDKETAEQNTYKNGRIDTREVTEWSEGRDTEPTKIRPEHVKIPLQTTERMDIINSSNPEVSTGQSVRQEEQIAKPAKDGFSVAQHASIAGTVETVEDSYIEIRSE